MLLAFKLVVSIAIPLAAFATGLRAAKAELLWLPRHPKLLVRSLLAILVLLPLATVLLLEIVSPGPIIAGGVIVAVLSIGIGPPAALKHAKTAEGRLGYEVGLNVTLLAASIVFVPAVVALLAAAYRLPIALRPSQVAVVVLTRALLPLAGGLLVARLAPKAALRIGRYAGWVVQGALVAVVLVALLASWRSLLGIGALGWLMCAAVALLGVVVGRLLGGHDDETSGVLESFSAMRFPALALLLTSVVPEGKRLVPVVLAYVITSGVLVGVYQAVVAARARRERPAALAPTPA